MREGEILGLKWNQVDFLSGIIRLRAGETKNDEAREIPIVTQLRSLLTEQPAKRQPGCEYVCFRFDRAGRAVKIGEFRKAWHTACIKPGLGRMGPGIDAPTGKPVMAKPRGDREHPKPRVKMVYRGMIFHDLRRTRVRNLVRAGVPERVAMEISGHKTRSVFDRYDLVSRRDVLEAGRKLGEFHSQNVGDNSGTAVHQDAAAAS
jgi:integrase